jgi:peptidoglycan glycosyltransferase
MNTAIIRVFVCVVVLFGLLVGFTSNWSVFDAEGLKDNPNNARKLIEELSIDRGNIAAANGMVLARSVPAKGGTFRRQYPAGGLFAHAVGWDFPDFGTVGLEAEYDKELLGETSDLDDFVELLGGKKDKKGQSLQTGLDPQGQQTAINALGGRPGSIVALEPDTGRVLVMVSVPGFNPADGVRTLRRLQNAEGSPLFNRATQSQYPPGSTMKVVTAVAAIDSGKFSASSVLDGNTGIPVGGVPLANFGGQSFGPVDLTTALTFSINTVWGRVAEQVGKETMGEYMRRFGFYKKPELDYPDDQMVISAPRSERTGRPLKPTSDQIDIGRVGIGQGNLTVTPLQMAEVAAAVANDGVLMRPRFGERLIDADGRTKRRINPREQDRVMSAETARTVKEMMGNVVREGSGTAAALSGVSVAGKTGTAETGRGDQAWFIGLAPIDDPQVAVAVTVEPPAGTGGEVAAPLAAQVIQSLLR